MLNVLLQLLFFVGAIAAFMGGAAYFSEVWFDRVSMRTTWRELTRFQLTAVVLAIGGIAVMLTSLILGALTKGM